MAEPIFLGRVGAKEYHWVPAVQVSDSYLAWRVPAIREAIRAKEGWKILSADYSQIEVALMAFLSQDPWLLGALNSGKDIHCYMTADVFGVSYEEVFASYKDKSLLKHDHWEAQRSNVKRVTFGVPYGAGAKRVAMLTGLDEDAAQALIDRYFSKARKLKEWLENQGRFALTYGYSQSIRGRMRFYRLPDPSHPNYDDLASQIRRYAGNQPIQSSCVDLLKPAMSRIYLALRGGVWNAPRVCDAHFLLTVHDELVLEARTEHVGIVSGTMTDCMLSIYNELVTGIPTKVDVSVADYWKKA